MLLNLLPIHQGCPYCPLLSMAYRWAQAHHVQMKTMMETEANDMENEQYIVRSRHSPYLITRNESGRQRGEGSGRANLPS